jgi:hypothetical protein
MSLLCSDASPSPGERRHGGEAARATGARRARPLARGHRSAPLLAALCVAGASLLATSAPAAAFSQHGHVEGFHFSVPAVPTGIAVNDSTGHLFVIRLGDGKKNSGCTTGCVEEFAPTPGVENPAPLHVLEVADPESIAIDNSGSPSHGDIYIAGTTKKLAKEEELGENKIVYKLNPEATAIIQHLKKFKPEKGETPEEFEPILGLAVDTSGNLFVYDTEGVVAKFSGAPKSKGLFSFTGEAPEFEGPTRGLAADSHGNMYLGHLSNNEHAVGPGGKPQVVGKCTIEPVERECEDLIPELNQERTTAVAVTPTDEVFLDNIDNLKASNTSFLVALSCPSSATSCTEIQRLEAPEIGEADAVAADAANGFVYVSGSMSRPDGTSRIDVFTPEAPGAPKVDSLSACVTSQCSPEAKSVKLLAEVDPSGADTHAYFEYGSASCASSPCEKKGPEPPGTDLGGGFGDQVLEFETPADLKAGVIYHFRVFAMNGKGQETSAERTFTIPAPKEAAPLVDGRAWEMVTPPDKDGYEPEPLVKQGGATQASKDGSAVTYVADGPIPPAGAPEGNRTPEGAQILSVRESSQWSTQDLSTRNSVATGVNVGQPQEYQWFSPNLSLSLLHPYAGPETAPQWSVPALAPPASNGEKQRQERGEPYSEKTLYVHNDAPIPPESTNAEIYAAAKANGETMTNNGFVAVVNEANALGVLSPAPGCSVGLCFGGGLHVGIVPVAATPDLNHVLIKSFKAGPGLYEWSSDGHLQLISVTPHQFVGTVTEKSKIITAGALAEALLTPGAEISGEGIPGGTKIEKLIKKGEWEMSAEATSTQTEKPFTVLASTGGGVTGGASPDLRHAISDSGSRVFWTEEQNSEPRRLYVRDIKTRETLELDAQSGVSGGQPHATFQTASADGTKVFFTDAQRLTSDSGAVEKEEGSPVKADLYVFELPPEGQPLTKGQLRDLTPEGIHGESAGVQGFANGGGVLGASNDGSYVYFVANAALSSNAHAGSCVEPAEGATKDKSCNLYVRHFNGTEWEATKLVAVLSNTDSPVWGATQLPRSLVFETARVSPSGHFLAFMSNRSLTGYNNVDQSPAAEGERDEEVFLYDAIKETIVCASCNPSGARPAGVFDLGNEKVDPKREAEGIGLIVDRPGVWGPQPGVDNWLGGSVPGWVPLAQEGTALYQPRYLSDEGRLFFNSPDHLVPAATGVKEKVYEYEPPGVGGCAEQNGCVGLLSRGNSESEEGGEHESAFLDASESGNDVFLLTAAKLSPGDIDTNFDVYDARVCNQGPGASSCIAPPALGSRGCEAEEACKGPAPKAPTYTVQASAIVPAPKAAPSGGTLPAKVVKPKPLTKAQLLAKALKTCRTKYKGNKKKKQRAACEASARKKYGPHKKGKKASPASANGRRA